MAKHFISVCIFCFLCATHSPCESHAGTSHKTTNKKSIQFTEAKNPLIYQSDSPEAVPSPEGKGSAFTLFKLNNPRLKRNRIRRETQNDMTLNINNNNNTSIKDKKDEDYIKKIFLKYGDGTTLTMDGFEKLLDRLDLIADVVHKEVDPLLSLKEIAALISHETDNMTDSNLTCLNREKLVEDLPKEISKDKFQELCPSLLYHTMIGKCTSHDVPQVPQREPGAPSSIPCFVWLYSLVAVIIISACGMLGLAVIPVMQKRYYPSLLQFLVALAVGTLAGDALLHLLPHAMSSGHKHGDHHDAEANHDENMWKGFVAMLGVVFFFFVERMIVFIAKFRKEKRKNEKVPKMKVMKEGLQPTSTTEKQCKHKYSSIPYCYDAIAMIDKNQSKEDYPVFRLLAGQDGIQTPNDTSTNFFELDSSSEPFKNTQVETNQNMTECPNESNASNCTEANKMLENEKEDTNSVEYTVILREHENKHHGHSHTHGHVHAAPKNLSSVAWMVIMGDGLHNFTDGMAIGAAFSASIAGGFSTAVAVFCHELPHELGDFAMLLKAGMTIKQALFYNILSSALCLLGNCFGVWLGNTEYASSWVFAGAAGTFIYIALVDMMPELSSGHEDDGTLQQCLLQLSGLLVGVGIMTFIALYEHDLKHMFREPL